MRRAIAMICVLACLLGGCAKKPAELVGEWQSLIAEEITAVFHEDGRLDDCWDGEVTATYSYERDGDKVMVTQYDDTYTLTLEGDKLLLDGEALYRKK